MRQYGNGNLPMPPVAIYTRACSRTELVDSRRLLLPANFPQVAVFKAAPVDAVASIVDGGLYLTIHPPLLLIVFDLDDGKVFFLVTRGDLGPMAIKEFFGVYLAVVHRDLCTRCIIYASI